jgi:small subunit ribosomal protein S1
MAETQGNFAQRLATLIKSDYDISQPRRGEVYEAVILSISENDIVVDLGVKRDGIVPPKDLSFIDEEYLESLEVGDHIPVAVLTTRDRDGNLVVSINKGLERKDWLRAQDLLDSGEIVEAEVTGHNRGGALVSLGGLEGFVPNSHLSSVPRGLRGQQLREAKEGLIGQTLPLIVIEVNQRRRRLVLSERQAMRRRRQRLLDELTEGEIHQGVVCNLVDFGAFVDLGGVDGLIHISELDWKHVDRPGEVLSVGDQVEVLVLDVDRERKRIALSRKRLLPDPWETLTDRLHVGDEIEGRVTGLTDFGVFVDVGGVDGLVHVSDMRDEEVVLEALESGDPVRVRALEIDEWQRRITLRFVDESHIHDQVAEEEVREPSAAASM